MRPDPTCAIHPRRERRGFSRNFDFDKKAYDAAARRLAGLFKANFAQVEEKASPEVVAAGPKE
ncbi:MAG: hypothetical protein R3310_09480 [Candidatus Competibacteraceae bacterium]|nr:hypothetical protein [Candidatus Competibacteraceae bacterium]